MPNEIKVTLRQESIGFVSEERLWLTVDGRVVRDGDYRASQLLVAKGGTIPDKLARKLKLDKGVKIEALETAPPKTVAPEEIQGRQTRPEKPSEAR